MNETPYHFEMPTRSSMPIFPSVWRTQHYLRGTYTVGNTVGLDEVWYIRSIMARNLPVPTIATVGYGASPDPFYQVQIRVGSWCHVIEVFLYGKEEWKFDPPLFVGFGESITINAFGEGFEEDGREINLYVHFIRCTGPDARKPFSLNPSVQGAIDEAEIKKVVEKSFRDYMEGMWDGDNQNI